MRDEEAEPMREYIVKDHGNLDAKRATLGVKERDAK